MTPLIVESTTRVLPVRSAIRGISHKEGVRHAYNTTMFTQPTNTPSTIRNVYDSRNHVVAEAEVTPYATADIRTFEKALREYFSKDGTSPSTNFTDASGSGSNHYRRERFGCIRSEQNLFGMCNSLPVIRTKIWEEHPHQCQGRVPHGRNEREGTQRIKCHHVDEEVTDEESTPKKAIGSNVPQSTNRTAKGTLQRLCARPIALPKCP